jgi:hypothetical protein
MEDSVAIAAQSAMGNNVSLSGTAYPYGAQSLASNAAAQQAAIYNYASQGVGSRDSSMLGHFKIMKAEDGFIVRCAYNEGEKYKSFIATTIDEAMDKAKAFLVIGALEK